MSNFYKSIATNYEYIFPTRSPQVSFVTSLISPGGRIIDVGCAVGGLSMALASNGFSVTGIDLDQTMIDLALARLSSSDLKVAFLQADMTKLDFNDPFDGIICLGNTLVHLSELQLFAFLSWARCALAPGGQLICQILNYDRIFEKKIDKLPIIENDMIRFERHYRHLNNKEELLFCTVLTVKPTGEQVKNEISLYPLKLEKLNILLKQAGFKNVELFGDFKKSPFDPATSFPLITVAS